VFLVFEGARITVEDITVKAGVGVLVLNAMVAFGLNVSVVFLVFFPPLLFSPSAPLGAQRLTGARVALDW